VTTIDGDVFARRSKGIPINDMTPLERRGSGRYPQAVSLSEEAMLANLAILGRQEGGEIFESPLVFTLARIERLQLIRDGLDDQIDPSGVRRAELDFRLRSLDEGLRTPLEPDARPIRWTRYFFDAQYRHLVSGNIRQDLHGSLGKQLEILNGPESPSWLVKYNLGFFDTDAMTMVVRGRLYVPVQVA
jgi:hypothetical protein